MMTYEKNLWLIVVLFLAAKNIQICANNVAGHPQVPCLFIFGDSLSDSGNNNNLPTQAKANYLPYGIDFPGGPTGRFTNGRTAIDIISQLLGFRNFIPPYANIGSSDIVEGVNYASGAAGIRNETGTHLGADIGLELQLTHHRDIVSKIAKKLGGVDKAEQHLNQCLYYVNIGSNDYLNNYFMPEHYPSSHNYNPEQYAEALIQQYSLQIRGLHQSGARKFALIGLGLVGCIPREISKKNASSCVEEENRAVLSFNGKLKALVDQFNNQLSDDDSSKFIYVNTAFITSNTPALSSLRSLKNVACCEVGKENNGQCAANKRPCMKRELYAFMDSFHPTEIVNKVIAANTYLSSDPTLTHPMDISKLVNL